jgi:foldase protein PrsA
MLKKLGVVLLLSTTLTACSITGSNSSSKDPNNVVEMKSGNITKDDFYDAMKKQVGENVLKDLIQTKVLESKYSVSDKEVDDRVQQIKSSFKTDDEFKNALTQAGISSEAQLRESTKKDLLYFKASTDGIKISDDEIKQYYEHMKYQIKASHILVKTKKEADSIEEKLKKGESFEELAKKNSIDTGSAVNGGDLGYFKAGSMVKEFEDAAFSLKVGEISQPVKSQYGYHIIKLVDKKKTDETIPPLSQAKETVKEELLRQKAKPIQPIIDKMVKDSNVKINIKDYKDILKGNN